LEKKKGEEEAGHVPVQSSKFRVQSAVAKFEKLPS
jgi:hypothetical protein